MLCLHLLLTVAVERLAVSAETRALPPGALSASSSRAVQKKLQRWALLYCAAQQRKAANCCRGGNSFEAARLGNYTYRDDSVTVIGINIDYRV